MPIAVAALVFCAQANSVPVMWELVGGHANGSFTYDADTNDYSSIDVSTSVDYDSLNPFSPSDNMNLNLINSIFTLDIDFAAPLTNAGGTIAYNSEGFALGIPLTDGSGTATGDGATAVPEPGTLAILGGGLLGLALMRRRRA